MAPDSPATVSAAFKMSIGGRPVEGRLEVAAGPAQLRQLLPILQRFANEAVAAGCEPLPEQGKQVSCRAGCGACCRQLAPVSQSEAYQLAELVERLSEPRRSEVRRRFEEAERRLAAAGLLERLSGPVSLAGDEARSIGMEYFRLGIACPFLEDESCSIHPDRPLVCREYLVTSPAENCRQPTPETIDQVRLPAQVSNVLLEMERGQAAGPLAWIPLSLALRWAAGNSEPAASRTGPEWVGEFFRRLAGRELPPPAPEAAIATPNRPPS